MVPGVAARGGPVVHQLGEAVEEGHRKHRAIHCANGYGIFAIWAEAALRESERLECFAMPLSHHSGPARFHNLRPLRFLKWTLPVRPPRRWWRGPRSPRSFALACRRFRRLVYVFTFGGAL